MNSGSWWWTGRPGVLQFMGSQRVGHNLATELTDWHIHICFSEGSDGKESACNERDAGLIPGSGRSSGEGNILAWRIPWTGEPGGLQSIGSQRVRHDWATNTSIFTFHTYITKAFPNILIGFSVISLSYFLILWKTWSKTALVCFISLNHNPCVDKDLLAQQTQNKVISRQPTDTVVIWKSWTQKQKSYRQSPLPMPYSCRCMRH